MNSRITDSLNENKNAWKNLGLLPPSTLALHGFNLEELNSNFLNISISPSKDPNDSLRMISTAPESGFAFSPVTTNYIILAVAHFKSQAQGDDGIPQSVIGKALSFIGPHLTHLLNASLEKGIFPSTCKILEDSGPEEDPSTVLSIGFSPHRTTVLSV